MAPFARSSSPVLLVEDDRVLAEILARFLTAHGYSVELAGSAEAATELLDHGLRPAVVVLDLNLPGDTGWSLVRGPSLTRAGDPPVIVATATAVSPKRLREYGIAGYLPKPFAIQTLASTIERLLDPDAEPTPDPESTAASSPSLRPPPDPDRA